MNTRNLLHKWQLMIKETHVTSHWLVARHMITHGNGSDWTRELERAALQSSKIYRGTETKISFLGELAYFNF
jgi:hypothetical protein